MLPPGAAAGGTIRLPSETEWEYAARGPGSADAPGWRYAWGHDADRNLGNYDESQIGRTSAVGLFPRGRAFGLDDLSGNVWEWTLSRWGKTVGSPDFRYSDWASQDPERNKREPIEWRIVRGGSWLDLAEFARCASRGRYRPDVRVNDLGFRVVWSGSLPG